MAQEGQQVRELQKNIVKSFKKYPDDNNTNNRILIAPVYAGKISCIDESRKMNLEKYRALTYLISRNDLQRMGLQAHEWVCGMEDHPTPNCCVSEWMASTIAILRQQAK
jgi:hypothetical protein